MQMSRDWVIELLCCLYPRGAREWTVDINNPGPDLACKVGVRRAYLGNTIMSAWYLSNVTPGRALGTYNFRHFRHLPWKMF